MHTIIFSLHLNVDFNYETNMTCFFFLCVSLLLSHSWFRVHLTLAHLVGMHMDACRWLLTLVFHRLPDSLVEKLIELYSINTKNLRFYPLSIAY